MTVFVTVVQTAYRSANRIGLIASCRGTVLNTHGSLIKPAKNWTATGERRLLNMFSAKSAAFTASPPHDGFAVANLGQRPRESCHPNRPALKARFTSVVTSFRALACCIDFRG